VAAYPSRRSLFALEPFWWLAGGELTFTWVVDKSNAMARYTAATFLANQGVPVLIDYRYAIMHNKFVIVDREAVETGSFNFTAAAERSNAENLLVLQDPSLAQRYGQEWERLWAEPEEMRARY
jgi:phosphatidylserine/phosphatidylglycerophosphate/cardiolipin synthase-like enzyme